MTSLFPALVFAALTVQLPAPQVMSPPMSGVPSNTIPDGITVRGNGTATVAADEAVVTLHVFTKNNAIVIDQASLQPVVDALVAAGIARTDITTPIYLTGSTKTNNATVTATIHNPSVTMIQNGMVALASHFDPNSQVLVNGAEVRLSANDCTAARKEAQAAAIHEARMSAQSLASQLGVRVGSVLAADFQSPFETGPSCTYNYPLGPYQANMFNTPEQLLQIHINSFVTIRYAIR